MSRDRVDVIQVSREDAKDILEALDNPPQPERLLERARQRQGVVKNCDVEAEEKQNG